ncbi:MAG: tetraacyldisaccharide 4'-kinase [Pelagibacteraceae bacterium]|jgi:tetraacyldisaccharide 4'-kinase|nr:tetraacyldisaccharide 4'-kinase [Pelagibacteraceae bacterium]|tara:strand:- start:7331 stop:8260 length:930 start_codon:yes stop_codon:yes gene_type:complete
MKIYKPNFWNDKKNFLAVLLYPLSLIYLLAVKLRKKFINQKQFKIPIICVGNIYIGGTGKTPTSIYLANDFSKSGYNPVIIRKFYKNHQDEHELIKSYFKKLILTKDRSAGLEEAINSEYDLAILDDGFQDHRIKKNVNILCFNSNQLVGNGLVFPSGPLRENLDVLKNADIILINGKKNLNFEKFILNINTNLRIFYSYFKPTNINKFKNFNLLALAGIGNPDNFFQLLEENELKIFEKLIYPDHYVFSKNEIENIMIRAKKENLKIVMTEKDYHKIKKFNFDNLEYLKILLEINEKHIFLNTIKNLI